MNKMATSKSSLYWQDPTSNVQVFEKQTTAGQRFYFFFLDKSQVTKQQIDALKKDMEDVLKNATSHRVSLKAGSSTYQILYSGTLTTQNEVDLFGAIQKSLAFIGYDDMKNPNRKQKGVVLNSATSAVPKTQPTATPPSKIEIYEGMGFYHKQDIGQLYVINEIGATNYELRWWSNEDNKYHSLAMTQNEVDASFKDGTYIEFISTLKVGDVFDNDHPSGIFSKEVVTIAEIGHSEIKLASEVNNNISIEVYERKDFANALLKFKKIHDGDGVAPKTESKVLPQSVINTPQIQDIKDELKNAITLKSLLNEIDFEKKVNISTTITKLQQKINEAQATEFEKTLNENEIFDKLFEQSTMEIKNRYKPDFELTEFDDSIAPNGKQSDLKFETNLLVNSDMFIEWFGDFKTAYFYRNLKDFGGINVSKVLSDKFEPLVVWHGTPEQFSYFRFDNFPLAYFAVNKEYAEFFATSRSKDGLGFVLPFFLSIKNPLDLTRFGIDQVSPDDFFNWMFLKTGLTETELDINPIMLKGSMKPHPIWVYLRNNPKMIQKIAKSNIYDGIVFHEFCPNLDINDDGYKTKAYVIFDAHQAKLADPNRGDVVLASLKSFLLKKGGKV